MTVSSLLSYQFAWNNFLFGNGTVHTLQSLDGLQGLPGIRNQDEDAGYADFSFSGNDFFSGRTITFTLQTFATAGGNSAQVNYNLLKAALLPQVSGTTPLQFRLSGSNMQRINARIRASITPVDQSYTFGKITSQWTFFCPDPKFYDDTLQTTTITINNSIGRGYNRTYNKTYGGGTANTAYTTVNNSGWANSYPVITITGPITNPTVGNYTSGQFVSLTGTFTVNDVIVIDLASKLVTKNGLTARNLVTGSSTWFNASAGAQQFYLNGTGTTTSITTATVAFRNAYV